jgi:hypothetical protein
MRFVIIICSILLLFSSVFAQDKVDGQDEYTASIRLVKTYIELRTSGISLSAVNRRIARLGDGVSIALLKIYDADALESPENIQKYLPTVRDAFSAPNRIQLSENRKPDVTIFLLKHLERKIEGENLKVQISNVIEFVKQQTSNQDALILLRSNEDKWIKRFTNNPF